MSERGASEVPCPRSAPNGPKALCPWLAARRAVLCTRTTNAIYLSCSCQPITHSSALPGEDDSRDTYKGDAHTSEITAPRLPAEREELEQQTTIFHHDLAKTPHCWPAPGLVLSPSRAHRVSPAGQQQQQVLHRRHFAKGGK